MRRVALSFLLILVSPTAWTEQSESDRYCEHLTYLKDKAAAEAPVPREEANNVDRIIFTYYDNLSADFLKTYSEAMDHNETFEEFRADAVKVGIALKQQLKSSYISDIIAKHCGVADYDDRLSLLPNGISQHHNVLIFSRQFDPRGHAYYDGSIAASH